MSNPNDAPPISAELLKHEGPLTENKFEFWFHVKGEWRIDSSHYSLVDAEKKVKFWNGIGYQTAIATISSTRTFLKPEASK